MSHRPARPFPLARTIVSLTAVAMFATFGAEVLVPDTRSGYDIVNVAAISQKPSTVGIADSDLYFASDEQISRTLDEMVGLGVTNVRVLIPWYDVNPDPGVYNWSKIDRVINAAKARNMGILATITHSPDWAVRPGDTPVISPPANVADFGDFTGLVAQRYRGTISAYEVWNEPNGAGSFYPAPDPARYTALLKDAYAKIKAVDPSVTVLAGVLGAVPTNPVKGEVNSPTFLADMYTAGAQGYFDAISFHPYQLSTPYSQGPTLTGSPINEVRDMRALMVSQGDAAKLIWASEYGLPTSLVSEAHQAAYISDFLAAWSAQNYAGPMFIYTTRDASGEYERDALFGIFREDWTPKAAAQVVADYIKAHPQTVSNPTVTPTPTFIEQVIRAVSQLAQTISMTVQRFFTAVFAAIAAVFSPPAAATVAPRSAARLAAAPTTTTPLTASTTTTVSSPTATSSTATAPTTTSPTSTGTTSTTAESATTPTTTTSGTTTSATSDEKTSPSSSTSAPSTATSATTPGGTGSTTGATDSTSKDSDSASAETRTTVAVG